MNERERFVEKVRTDVRAAGEALGEMTRQIERQESEARLAASKVREEIVEAGQQSVADLLNTTRQEISALRKSAQQEADATIAAARKGIQGEAGALADHMVAALLKQRSTN
jgi:F0F1-type ATP synthase membrane subunit b/b'